MINDYVWEGLEAMAEKIYQWKHCDETTKKYGCCKVNETVAYSKQWTS